MKKFTNIFFTALIFIGLGYFMTGTFLKDQTSDFAQSFNKYNLLADKGPKFVKVDNQVAADYDGEGNYTYYLKSYDRQSRPHYVEFTGYGKLKQGQYIKLDTRGTHVKSYKKVSRDSLPYNVSRKLRKDYKINHES